MVSSLHTSLDDILRVGNKWRISAEQKGPESVEANKILKQERKEFERVESTTHGILDDAINEADSKTAMFSGKIDRIDSQTDQVFDTFGQVMDKHTEMTDEEAEELLSQIMNTEDDKIPGGKSFH